MRKAIGPYSLDPPDSPRGPDGSDNLGVHYEYTLKKWTWPSPFQTCDNRIVRRSNALLGHAYGETKL